MLEKKTILITGANRGIGFELVKESLSKNFFVIGTYRNKINSKNLLKINSNNTLFFIMDVINEQSIINVSKNLNKPIDYLICNAGINNGFGNFLDKKAFNWPNLVPKDIISQKRVSKQKKN